MKTKKRKSPRHCFIFRIEDDYTGKIKKIKAWAKVVRSKTPVDLPLTANDVRNSIRLKGVGNTQTCTMSVCAKRNSALFPHPVEGYVDWQYSACYVVSKLNKETGLPTECVLYHHRDNIAKTNDSINGQRKLLAELEEKGDRFIHLLPPAKSRPNRGNDRANKSTGRFTPRPASVGASLRFATALMGGVS